VPGLVTDERCEVVALADVNQDTATTLSEQFSSRPVTYTDYHELLQKEKPELVVACLWTPLHLSVFRDSVAAGVRAYHSEKPMAPTWGESLKMAELAEQNKLQFTMSNLSNNIQNIESSRSSIEDADFAAEATDLAKNQILEQSATAMLAQASAISQNILSLLR